MFISYTCYYLQLLKKYRASTSALCAAQSEAREAECRAEAAAEEARQSKERLAELSARLAHAEAGHSHEHHEAERRLELRNKVPPATTTTQTYFDLHKYIQVAFNADCRVTVTQVNSEFAYINKPHNI